MQAIDWADAPFHYVSFRMWDQAASYYRTGDLQNVEATPLVPDLLNLQFATHAFRFLLGVKPQLACSS